jgi:hypothetical protein
MPYLNDPRRTVTLNLHPAEYEALADDAFEAGYATPGTYAKALVEARGEPPAPRLDEHSAERVLRLEAKNAWLLHQFEAALDALQAAGLRFTWGDLPPGEQRPRSRAAQQRAVARAVTEALQQEQAARRARLAAKPPPAGSAPATSRERVISQRGAKRPGNPA